MRTATSVPETGARAAGRHGLGLLSLGATSDGGFNALASNWAIAEELARFHLDSSLGPWAGLQDANRASRRARALRVGETGRVF